MDTINKNMKKEMVDFVSFYRRFSNVAGKQSFSTLYTAINVLAGHYTSYGTKFPVPEKRRKRLYRAPKAGRTAAAAAAIHGAISLASSPVRQEMEGRQLWWGC